MSRKAAGQPAASRLFPGLGRLDVRADVLVRLVGRMIDRDGVYGRQSSDRDNPRIPAGYTYLGQFLNHDISHQARFLGHPGGERAGRVPRLNLDVLYGTTPQAHGQLYDFVNGKPRTFRIGKTRDGKPRDLPRRPADGQAVIPDQANDNNLIVAQLTVLFMRFHNRLVEKEGLGFDEAREQAVLHYQCIVISDLLPKLLAKETFADVRDRGPRFYREAGRPFIPLEFSLAAYRLHTMSRNRYQLNAGRYLSLESGLAFTGRGGGGAGTFPLDPSLVIDWTRFFATGRPGEPYRRSVNPSHRIGPLIAQGLHEFELDLPAATVRNLRVPFGRKPTLVLFDVLRGNNLVPSGQDLVRHMNDHGLAIPALSRRDLYEGPLGYLNERGLLEETPLFYYLMKEAEVLAQGLTLGPAGSRIVAETIFGLLEADESSLLHRPDWKPLIASAGNGAETGKVAMTDLVTYMAGPD